MSSRLTIRILVGLGGLALTFAVLFKVFVGEDRSQPDPPVAQEAEPAEAKAADLPTPKAPLAAPTATESRPRPTLATTGDAEKMGVRDRFAGETRDSDWAKTLEGQIVGAFDSKQRANIDVECRRSVCRVMLASSSPNAMTLIDWLSESDSVRATASSMLLTRESGSGPTVYLTYIR